MTFQTRLICSHGTQNLQKIGLRYIFLTFLKQLQFHAWQK